MPETKTPRAGAVVAGALAFILTVTDIVVLRGYDVEPVWVWLQIPVVALAWTAPFAWARRNWSLAGIGLLAMLGGLWGYLYLPPLAALVMAVMAFIREVRSDGQPLRTPGPPAPAPDPPAPRPHR